MRGGVSAHGYGVDQRPSAGGRRYLRRLWVLCVFNRSHPTGVVGEGLGRQRGSPHLAGGCGTEQLPRRERRGEDLLEFGVQPAGIDRHLLRHRGLGSALCPLPGRKGLVQKGRVRKYERENIYDTIGQNPLLGASDFTGRGNVGATITSCSIKPNLNPERKPL